MNVIYDLVMVRRWEIFNGAMVAGKLYLRKILREARTRLSGVVLGEPKALTYTYYGKTMVCGEFMALESRLHSTMSFGNTALLRRAFLAAFITISYSFRENANILGNLTWQLS